MDGACPRWLSPMSAGRQLCWPCFPSSTRGASAPPSREVWLGGPLTRNTCRALKRPSEHACQGSGSQNSAAHLRTSLRTRPSVFPGQASHSPPVSRTCLGHADASIARVALVSNTRLGFPPSHLPTIAALLHTCFGHFAPGPPHTYRDLVHGPPCKYRKCAGLVSRDPTTDEHR